MLNQRLLIHIGYPKTGSTWLQQVLFTDEKTRFKAIWGKRGELFPTQGYADAIEQFVIANPFRFNAKSAYKVFEPFLQEAAHQGLVSVLSQERLAAGLLGGTNNLGKDVADRIHATFPNALILIFIREQKAIIKSAYAEYLFGAGGTATIQRFIGIEGICRKGFRPPLPLDYLEYDLLVEYYQKLFSKDNVLVLPFELLKRDQVNVCQKIIDFAQTKGVPPLPRPPQRVSPKGADLIFQLYINRIYGNYSSRSSLIWRMAFKARSIINRAVPQCIHRHIDERFENIIKEGVGDYFRKSNQKTGSLIGVNLADFGYDC